MIPYTQHPLMAGLMALLLISCEKQEGSSEEASDWSEASALSDEEKSKAAEESPITEEELASGLYYTAYIHHREAAQLEDTEKKLSKLLKAEDCLLRLKQELPEWEPEIVTARLKLVKSELLESGHQG